MTATRLPATTLFLTERIGRSRLRLALTRLLRGDRLPAAVWPQALRLRLRAWELTGRMAALGVRRRLAMISHADVVRDVRRGLRCERSEEHTSELQSLMRNSYAVFCLKKKKKHR